MADLQCTVILREVRHDVLAESRKMGSDVTYFPSDVLPETKTEISSHDRASTTILTTFC